MKNMMFKICAVIISATTAVTAIFGTVALTKKATPDGQKRAPLIIIDAGHGGSTNTIKQLL